VLQVESHPFLTQEKLLRYCQQEKIAYTAFSPLGAQSYFSLGMADELESLLAHSLIHEVAACQHRTPAQVLLRWGIQRGTAVVPKSANEGRLKENLAVFDFELSGAEMRSINGLNRNRRFNDPGDFCETAFNTFYPIYE
jgi:D-xylose reductase